MRSRTIEHYNRRSRIVLLHPQLTIIKLIKVIIIVSGGRGSAPGPPAYTILSHSRRWLRTSLRSALSHHSQVPQGRG